MQKAIRQKRRQGLTLLELVIVLTILVAVGGIAVAIFPQFLTKAHTSTCSANIPELFKAIQMYDAMYTDGYPDRVDTLCVGGSLAGFLPEGTGLVEYPLDSDEVNALNEAGITDVTTMIEDPGTSEEWHPTFWPYADTALGGAGANFVPIADGTTVATLSEENAQILGLETGKTYAVFGLNSPCKMFGKTLNEAPVHFSDDMADNPNEYYLRFAAVFQLTDDTGGPGPDGIDGNLDDVDPTVLSKARLRAIAAIHTGGLEGVAAHTQAYWADHEDANH